MRTLNNDFTKWLKLQRNPIFALLAEELATGEPTTAIRLNSSKQGEECSMARMEGSTPVPWCPEGIYLPTRPEFTIDPALHQGRY